MFDFKKFYKYEELTELVDALARKYPELLDIIEIGKSHEGRRCFVIAVSDKTTGSPDEKPALWLDGNIHATELSASSMCLYHLKYLLENFGKDEAVTRCLKRKTFYICPRLNPDGAEWALADKPRFIRSSTRATPLDEAFPEGLSMEDVDGDGRILSMRVKDPGGAWKKHPEDPRLMTARLPEDREGEFYRLLPEGRLTDYDGFRIPRKPVAESLDLNRNFPLDWQPESSQQGAGPYPASEPEVRAVLEFFTKHNNIVAGISFHTFSGVVLRPYCARDDKDLPPEDLWNFKTLGDKATEFSGYPHLSIYHDFRYHPKKFIHGSFDWIYEHLGMYMWVVELWSPQRQAGIENIDVVDWFRDHPAEDDLKLLRWSDRELQGQGYIDWYPFDHPELGPVELGGWNTLHSWRNPPFHLLEKELAPFPKWLLHLLESSPLLEVPFRRLQKLSGGLYKLTLGVQNMGWMGTEVTAKARERQKVKGVRARILTQEGLEIVEGRREENLGELAGWCPTNKLTFMATGDFTDQKALVSWVLRLDEDLRSVEIEVSHERAGKCHLLLDLEAALEESPGSE
jgi:murein tripeptide amidase MpaA/ribosomal protein L34